MYPYNSTQKRVKVLQKLFYSKDCLNKTAKSCWQFYGNLFIYFYYKKYKNVLLFMTKNLSKWSLEN